MQDQDLAYLIRVQDSQLRELMRNLREINKEIARSEGISTKSGAGVSRSYAQVDTAAGRSLKSIAKAGAVLGVGFLTVDQGIAKVRDAVDEASKLAAQIRNVEETFGSSGNAVLEWSEKTTDRVFVAKREALEAAAAFGSIFKSAEVLPGQAAELSRVLVELGGDLAALKQQDPNEVFARLRTGLIGRGGGLRQYEVLLTKARIEQEALAASGKEDAKALTDQEKILARYRLILQDTVGAQGSASELAGEHAGQTRKLTAEITDLEGRLGGLLIPTLTEGATVANDLFDALELIGSLKDIVVGVKIEAEELVGFELPDLPNFLNRRTLLQGGIIPSIAIEQLKALADGAGDASRELDALKFPSLAGGAFDAEAAAIEKKLRTRLGDALEDVQKKALRVFDRETDALVDAHDDVTEGLLDAFDKTTDEMLERMKVLVKVGEDQFRIGQGELTPAERELEALEKIEQKRNLRRETLDAKDALAQALIVGDPVQIRESKRRLEDAEAERRKIKLGARAETERAAADKALEEEERQLSESRDKQREALADSRRDLRDNLAERRKIQRENLDGELKAQTEALEKGKKKAADAQRQILATLRKFGVEYKGVGEELGGEFLKGFTKAMGMRLKVQPIKPHTDSADQARGGARGGIAGQLGPAAPSDTLPAWLTPGEMILTSADQRRVARMLGTRSTGWPLLSQIRMGFAQGGVADEDLFRQLLERFSHSLSTDALEQVRGRRGLTPASVLTGGGSEALRRLLDPIHIFAKVKSSTTAAQRAKLGPARLRELYSELAQRQAHPGRSGLIRYVGGEGVTGGSRYRDPWAGGSGTNLYGDVHASFPNVRDGYEAFEEMRGLFLRQQRRNSRRRRGRNKERGL